jgi:hypothetical protein
MDRNQRTSFTEFSHSLSRKRLFPSSDNILVEGIIPSGSLYVATAMANEGREGHGAFLSRASGMSLVIPYGSRHDASMNSIFLQRH